MLSFALDCFAKAASELLDVTKYSTFETKLLQACRIILEEAGQTTILLEISMLERAQRQRDPPRLLSGRAALALIHNSFKPDLEKASQTALNKIKVLRCHGYSDLQPFLARFSEVAQVLTSTITGGSSTPDAVLLGNKLTDDLLLNCLETQWKPIPELQVPFMQEFRRGRNNPEIHNW